MVTCPGEAPGARVTNPELLTLARTLFEDHATTRPVKTFPAASFSVALSWTLVWVAVSVAVGGVTSTVATGAGITLTTDVPETVPNVAETFVVPIALPVTNPLASTVAVAGALDAHVSGIPAMALFAASRTTAVSWRV